MSDQPLIADVVPELAERLEALLRERGEPHLADQVTSLRVTHVCRCGQPYCGSFWTVERPMRRWVNRGRQVELREGLPGEVGLRVSLGLALVALTTLIWLMEGTILMIVGRSLDLNIGVLDGVFLIVLSSFMAMVPAAPGYVGTFDAALIFAPKNRRS